MTERTFPELRGDKQREGLRPQRCEGGRMCVCGNEGWFRVGGPLPVNCVSSAFCLPINWPCGVYPTGQAARERSQVLRENRTTALHSLWDVKTKNQKVRFSFSFLFFLFIFTFLGAFNMLHFYLKTVTAATWKLMSKQIKSSLGIFTSVQKHSLSFLFI